MVFKADIFSGNDLNISRPQVSVIVPFFQDEGDLAYCIACLEGQDFCQENFEVLLVDNNPEPVNWAAVRPNYTYLHEPEPGSYAARNKGLNHVKADIVAFTDADCRPAKDWLSKAVAKLMKSNGKTIIAGEINLYPRSPGHPNLYECYDIAIGLRQKRYVTMGGFSATANMVAPRQAFRDVGLFDSRLKSGGDYEWGCRARLKGYSFLYSPDVIVNHPARKTFFEIQKKVSRTTGGIWDIAADRKRKLESRPIAGIKGTPLQTFISVVCHEKLPKLRHKVSVLLVALFVVFIKLLEKTRLFLGKESSRK